MRETTETVFTTIAARLVAGAVSIVAANARTVNPAPVAQTGQLISCGPGDDGKLQKGVAWPDPRFTDNLRIGKRSWDFGEDRSPAIPSSRECCGYLDGFLPYAIEGLDPP